MRPVDVGGVRQGEGLDELAGLVSGAGGVDPVGEDPLDRVPHHVDESRVGAVLVDALGHAVEAGAVGVVRRRLAVDLHAVVEAALVPVEPEVPVLLGGEEVEFLRLRHVDVGMAAEVMVDRGRAALEATDDYEVRQGVVSSTCGGGGAGCDRRRNAPLRASTWRHRPDRRWRSGQGHLSSRSQAQRSSVTGDGRIDTGSEAQDRPKRRFALAGTGRRPPGSATCRRVRCPCSGTESCARNGATSASSATK